MLCFGSGAKYLEIYVNILFQKKTVGSSGYMVFITFIRSIPNTTQNTIWFRFKLPSIVSLDEQNNQIRVC